MAVKLSEKDHLFERTERERITFIQGALCVRKCLQVQVCYRIIPGHTQERSHLNVRNVVKDLQYQAAYGDI